LITKCVVLIGDHNSLHPTRPIGLFPLLHSPLLEYLVADLSRFGITDIIVCISGGVQVDEVSLGRQLNAITPQETSVVLRRDDQNRGTAGVLKDLAELLADDLDFGLIHGSVFLNGMKWDELITSHARKSAIITTVLFDSLRREQRHEWISLNDDGEILEIHNPHSTSDRRSEDRRQSTRTAGVFVLSRRVFEFISDTEYMNLKEQVIPHIAATASDQVACFYSDPAPVQLTSWSEYMNLNRSILRNWVIAGNPDKSMANFGHGVWVESGGEIASSAYVLGPVLVGAGSRKDGLMNAKTNSDATTGVARARLHMASAHRTRIHRFILFLSQ
jgi:NDP-sugar pyrophosphorylase family protein